MVFGETSRSMRLLVVAMFGALLVHSAAAQESSAGSFCGCTREFCYRAISRFARGKDEAD